MSGFPVNPISPYPWSSVSISNTLGLLILFVSFVCFSVQVDSKIKDRMLMVKKTFLILMGINLFNNKVLIHMGFEESMLSYKKIHAMAVLQKGILFFLIK